MASKLSGIELTRYDDLFKTDAEREADRQERIQIVPAAEIFPYSRQPYTIVGENFRGKYSVQILADQVADNATAIQRYVRLNKLIPPLLDAVDTGTLKFVPAADFISHLSEKEQTYLLLVMERDEVSPSLGQAQRLKQLSAEGKLENNIIDLIMREEKPLERKVTIRNDRLQKYFPASYTPKQMEEVIIKLLEGWHRKRQQEQAR